MMNRRKKPIVLLCMGLTLSLVPALFGLESSVSAGASLERDTIKIGVASALKRPWGVAALRGTEMAVKEINDAGGVLGAKIQIFSADTESTAPKATEAIEKLYYSDKVDAIVGAYSSEESTAFQEEAAKLKINILFHGTPGSLDEKYKSDPEKYKYYWDYITSEYHVMDYAKDVQLNLLISAIKKQLGIEKVNVAVITDVALWTEKIHSAWQEAVKKHPDANLVYVGKISRDAVDFTAELTELRSKNAQLIMAGMGYSAGYTFVKQAYDVQLPVLMSGLIALSWSASDFLKAVGVDAAAYISSMGMMTHPTTPNTAKKLKEYESLYGGEPHMCVGHAYNGVMAYAKAVEMAGSLDHDKVSAALQKVKLAENESWNAKEFWFDNTHRVHISSMNGMIIYTFQYTSAGKAQMVEPAEYKTGEVLLPPWMIKQWKKK